MAIDQTNVASNIGTKTVTETVKLLDAVKALQALEEQRVAAGITLTDFDATFAAGSNKHMDGAAFNAILNTSIPEIWKFMTGDVTAVLGQQHDDNLQKARP